MKPLIFVFIGAYLAGSVNFAILVFKALGKDDPRAGFSGNPGATNVYRQAGYFWAVLVLILDMSRALGVAFIALHLVPVTLVPWAGLGLILGNRLPRFYNDYRTGCRRNIRPGLVFGLCNLAHPFYRFVRDGVDPCYRDDGRM